MKGDKKEAIQRCQYCVGETDSPANHMDVPVLGQLVGIGTVEPEKKVDL